MLFKSMELGENGATGKLVQHPVMVELNRESDFVIVLSPNMAVMTVPQMARLTRMFKNATRTDVQVRFTVGLPLLSLLLLDIFQPF